MINLDFLNKNMYRKYPFRDTCELTFLDGTVFLQELITSLQISTVYGQHELFASKLYIDPGYISLTINDYNTGTVIGCFAGKISADFAVIPFVTRSSTISGSMTVGLMTSASKISKGVYYLRNELADQGSRDNGLLEHSTIFCFTPPAVSKINVGTGSVVGKVATLKGNNLAIQSPTSTELKLTVTNINSIMSNNEFSGQIGNCNTPVITKINTVTPDSNGNIDIYGILPIVINVESGELSMASGLDLLDVCPEKNIVSAPAANTSNTYYTDIFTATQTEWQTWAIFNP